jgi:thiol:disulfide interchange protein DsbD
MERLFETLRLSLETGNALAYPAALLAGVMISFTPCVYPIMPITVGYIGARSAGSRGKGFLLSLSYVLGIAVIYSILGCVAALTGRVFGQISTSPLAYIAVANVCIILGLSMLGVFELRLPSFTRTSPDETSSGLLSAFAVGLASGLVVGPCTAPVLAVILTYVATKQNLIFGATILFTFAFGMGLVLMALGTFTGLLASMPKAGTWLTNIKKVFGWILILAGQYFLFMAGRLSF